MARRAQPAVTKRAAGEENFSGMHFQGLFHAWESQGSSLLNVLMPDGFPIAPQWILPILTAGLTATKCLSASESAEIAPVRLHSCNVVSTPGIRWVRWGGRGDEMRLRGVVIRSPGTD